MAKAKWVVKLAALPALSSQRRTACPWATRPVLHFLEWLVTQVDPVEGGGGVVHVLEVGAGEDAGGGKVVVEAKRGDDMRKAAEYG
mgnify:CR=1 FL=1